jgi:hypothetical protein
MPSNGSFAYSARISLSRPADSVMARLKILNPSGKLMIQQTRIENNADTGTVIAAFERDMSDLQLSPGAYPVQLEVRIAQKGQIVQGTVEAELLVYDPKRPRLPVAICARVSGQPLADPKGRFVADPGQYTQVRDDVLEIAAWVVAQPDARITLAVSPLLLSEWSHIASGYELVGPEGTARIAADSPVPQAYGSTLALLGEALDTGRLELTTQGFSDPDLSALATHGMVQDVDIQYAKGLSATFSSVETTPSTGTIPAGGCLPPEAASTLARHGVEYVVVGQSCARFRRTKAAPGIYKLDGPPVRVLVADDALSQKVTGGDTTGQIREAFDRAIAPGLRGPLVVSCDVGPGAASARALIAAYDTLADQAWLRVDLTRALAARTPSSVAKLVNGKEDSPAPKGYWRDVKTARDWSQALTAALADSGSRSQIAEDDSLIAQCSAWAGPEGKWDLADRGRTYSATALRSARDVLSAVSLRVEAITLAGSSGEVPVTITNGGDAPLSIDVVATTSKGVSISGDQLRRVELSPKDNFVELPVSMPDALRGKLTVTVASAGVVLARKTVDVRASYLDRLAIIGAVVTALGVMLVFIIRRVRSAESTEGTNRG